METVEMKMSELRKLSNFIDDEVVVSLRNPRIQYDDIILKSTVELEKSKEDVERYYKQYVELLEKTAGLKDTIEDVKRIHEIYRNKKFEEEMYDGELIDILVETHFRAMQTMFLETNEIREKNLKLFRIFNLYTSSLENVRRLTSNEI